MQEKSQPQQAQTTSRNQRRSGSRRWLAYLTTLSAAGVDLKNPRPLAVVSSI